MIDKITLNHAGQNNGKDETLRRILDELLTLKTYIEDSLRSNRVIISNIIHYTKSFPLRISPVNVAKFAVFCGSGHIY